MRRLLGRMEGIPGAKVHQNFSTELAMGVRWGLSVDALVTRSAEKEAAIHRKIEETIARVRARGSTANYNPGPLKELPRILTKVSLCLADLKATLCLRSISSWKHLRLIAV